MWRQRNMYQMEEQNKTPENNWTKWRQAIHQMQSSKCYIRILSDFSENFNKEIENIKKSQSEMKNIWTEMKNTLQGINSGVDKTQRTKSAIWKIRKQKTPNQNSKKKKYIKKWGEYKELLGQLQSYQYLHHGNPGRRRERARDWKPIWRNNDRRLP